MALHKILKIVGLLLSLAGIVFYIMLAVKGDAAIESDLLEGTDVNSVNWMLYAGYAMFFIVLAFVIVFALKNIFEGDIKKTLLSVGVFVVIGVLSYVLADSSLEGLPLVDDQPVTETASKWVGTGLHAFYILAVLAVGAIVFSGIKKLTTR